MIASHIQYAIEKKETFNMIFKPEEYFKMEQLEPFLQKRNDYSNWFDEVIEEGVKTGEFRIKELKMACMICVGAVNWIKDHKPNGDKTTEEIQGIYTEYLLKVMT